MPIIPNLKSLKELEKQVKTLIKKDKAKIIKLTKKSKKLPKQILKDTIKDKLKTIK